MCLQCDDRYLHEDLENKNLFMEDVGSSDSQIIRSVSIKSVEGAVSRRTGTVRACVFVCVCGVE